MIPIANLAITFKDGLTTENLDLVKEEFEPLYKDIKGVSDVIPFGNTNPVISVKIDNKKMAQNKVSLQNVMQVLNGRNTGVAIGEKVIDRKTSNIKVVGNLTSIDRLKAVRVTPNTTLGEISKIEESKNDSMINRYNGKDVIALSIAKDSQSNAVTISKEVKKVTEQINEKYPNQESTVYISAANMVETLCSIDGEGSIIRGPICNSCYYGVFKKSTVLFLLQSFQFHYRLPLLCSY